MAGHQSCAAAAVVLLLSGLGHIAGIGGARKQQQFSAKQMSPNFEPEYPQFTPFNTPEFIRIGSGLRVRDETTTTTTVAAAAPTFQPHPKRQHFSVADVVDDVDDVKPFKTFMLDLYKNYRNAYMNGGGVGNQTIGAMFGVSPAHLEDVIGIDPAVDDVADDGAAEWTTTTSTTTKRPKRTKTTVRRKLKTKTKNRTPETPNSIIEADEIKYNVGPGVNISLEPEKELVNVYLDEDCLKDVFTGRGRKHDLISKILPLFILPFLIQSAIVPFAVTTLKLLLVKSILIGKIAIFLLIVSALKNHHQKFASFDSPPQYVVDPPSRRSEANVGGYRVEGRPTTWIN